MVRKLIDLSDVGRAVLALILGIATAAVGLWLLSPDAAIDLLKGAGYWMILLAFVGFIWAMAHNVRAWRDSLRFSKADWICCGALALFGIILLVHEDAGFKILMDEIHLLGTSMAMHLERLVFVPQRGNELNGVFELTGGMVDKRPLFFPFLASCVHDLLGYRPENLFLLNGVLTFVLLGLAYIGGRALAGWRAGLFAAAGWAALPLLGQNARGGGFELLNVVMISMTAVLGGWHYYRRDTWSLLAFVYAGLLLAQVRYESPLFLVPVAIVVGLVWYEQRAIKMPWLAAVLPVLLLPVPLLMRVFEARPGSWELASKPGYKHVFSVLNIPENLGHAFAYWFNFGVEQPNAPFIAAIGLLGIILYIAVSPRFIRSWQAQELSMRVAWLFALALIAHLTLLLCYFWGRFDEPVIRRLSLPTHLLFLLAPVLVVRAFASAEKWFTALAASAVIALFVSGVPGLAKQAATKFYYPALDVQWRREFMRARPERDYLFIDNDSTIWITHMISATPIARAQKEPDVFAFNLRNRLFSGIFVFQRFDIDHATGKLRIKPDDDLGPAYELEPMAERTFNVDLLSRISRVRAIRGSGNERIEAAPILPPIGAVESSRDTRERAFVEEWLKRLP
jgi:hypothetical protein